MTKKWERNPSEVQSGLSFISAALSSCCHFRPLSHLCEIHPKAAAAALNGQFCSRRSAAWRRAGQLENSAKKNDSGD